MKTREQERFRKPFSTVPVYWTISIIFSSLAAIVFLELERVFSEDAGPWRSGSFPVILIAAFCSVVLWTG